MTLQESLRSALAVCDLHVRRMNAAFPLVADILPLTEARLGTLDVHEVNALEMIIGRFAKLQDYMGEVLFPLILEALTENVKGLSMIDMLNKLEKREFLPDIYFWRDLREVRNKIPHEYPDRPDLAVQSVNHSVEAAKALLHYWQTLQPQLGALAEDQKR